MTSWTLLSDATLSSASSPSLILPPHFTHTAIFFSLRYPLPHLILFSKGLWSLTINFTLSYASPTLLTSPPHSTHAAIFFLTQMLFFYTWYSSEKTFWSLMMSSISPTPPISLSHSHTNSHFFFLTQIPLSSSMRLQWSLRPSGHWRQCKNFFGYGLERHRHHDSHAGCYSQFWIDRLPKWITLLPQLLQDQE